MVPAPPAPVSDTGAPKICKTKQALMICGIDTATICTAIEVHKLDHLQIFAIICGTANHDLSHDAADPLLWNVKRLPQFAPVSEALRQS